MAPSPARRRIALLVEYDGSAFSGSQAQDASGGGPALRTVQWALEQALCEFTGERQRLAFAGRTDAGVHALGQVVALDSESAHDTDTFVRALNHFLPQDVAVRAAAEVERAFDSGRDARRRVYRYEIDDGGECSPLRRHRAWQLAQPLDAGAMAAAARALPLGERDWAAFAGPLPEGRSTVRDLACLDVQRRAPRRLALTMAAGGFLPHQVRRTAGALQRVGAGKLDPAGFAALLDGPPASAGPVAPPQGLTLISVRYREGTVRWDGELAEAPR